ncbi:MAG: 3-isopropylmalate dehydratase small subunit [Firmicutes bacterium]|uniref:3-isopropylmalate dehydratase small subunit n=1 Tax=Sulfobacillus benefaciens TaxID=453960 RepID=A0A2T2X1I4_9FIRM|nr:3-isopropylmalate dehydratase small subunit [Bacillota bacterium]MCL5013908.1 3-isopropylmalate dehydratase small subunit [Bacillota bacterium]PSR28345.1 MAG: 3-isopropylmalate dehydratase small subunit [Sulfobacillus benefaciens]
MTPLRQHRGLAVPLNRANIDTDQIIPKQFLKRVERSGFGQFLFFDWRYDQTGEPRSDFILNAPRYQGASILIAGQNFGCGSSREHAPWALSDYGFRVIVASSFADIFYNNCFKNGMLPLKLPEATVRALMTAAEGPDPLYLTVDVEHLSIHSDDGRYHYTFSLDPFLQDTLLHGLDDIARTLQYEDRISQYEEAHG